MNFESLVNSPVYKREPESFTDSVLSPPPSPKSPSQSEDHDDTDEFQENLKFNSPISPCKVQFVHNSLKPGNSNVFPTTWFKTQKANINPESSASVSKLSKEELYPNWFKSVETKINSPSPQKKKKPKLVKKNGFATHCYICNNNVKFENLEHHLYFGYVKCEDCDRVIKSCLKYSNPKISITQEDGNCTHAVLDWVLPPVDNLKRLWDEEESTFTDSLMQYIKSLNALKNTQPYKKAITCCNNYLKEKKYSSIREKSIEDEYLETTSATASNLETTSDTASTLDSVSLIRKKLKSFEDEYLQTKYLQTTSATSSTLDPVASIRKKLKAKTRVRKKKAEVEGPLLPEDGFYLILKKPIEECPNCYETFNPKFLEFNTSNWLISIKCKGCQLPVCFILDPPDGRDSKLTIINGL